MKKGEHPRADLYRAARNEGKSYNAIAAMYGVSPQAVRQACYNSASGRFRGYTAEDCVYPNLRRWLNENQVSRNEFIRRMGYIPNASQVARISSYFRGTYYPQKQGIDKMLRITGLTYEEFFWRDEHGEESTASD